MAYVGLARPVVAAYSEKNGKAEYYGGIRFGKAVKIEINPAYEDISEYNDINNTDDEERFSHADVKLETDEVPEEAEIMMFGRETDGSSRETDRAQYVGMGVRIRCVKNGKIRYLVVWIHKIKFREGGASHETKGNSVNYQTPITPGKATPDAEGKWRTKKVFETREEADVWLNEKAGIKE